MINNRLEFLKAEARADKYLREKLMREHMKQQVGTEGEEEVQRVVVVPLYREDISLDTEDSIFIDCDYCDGLDGDFYANPERFVKVSVDRMVRKVGHLHKKSVITMICNMIDDVNSPDPN